nr:nucleocapsid [blackberry line pattern virus]
MTDSERPDSQAGFDAAGWLDSHSNLTPDVWNVEVKKLSTSKQKKVKAEIERREAVRASLKETRTTTETMLPPPPPPPNQPLPPPTDDNPVIQPMPQPRREGKEHEGSSATVTESMIQMMWIKVNDADVSTFDRESVKVYLHQGFSPNKVLESMMIMAKKSGISDDQMITDIMSFCAISVIRGSINEHNFKKLSEEGKKHYLELEKKYSVKRGSGRNEAPNVLTVSRIGSAFPGKIIQLLADGKVSARKFIGPFKSHLLPNLMRHQAFAAVIPSTLNEVAKEFLLNLVTAFSADQTIAINPNKKTKLSPEVVFETQRSFIQIISDNEYPPEQVRLKIFRTFTSNYDEMLGTARALQKIVPEFQIPSKDVYVSHVAAVMQ